MPELTLDTLEKISPVSRLLYSFLEPSQYEGTLLLVFLIFVATLLVWCLYFLPLFSAISYMDVKFSADIQRRVGPNRVGPFGFFQILADTIKVFFKEDMAATDSYADALTSVSKLGPLLSFSVLACALANIPFSKSILLTNLDVGVVWMFLYIIISTLLLVWSSVASSRVETQISGYKLIQSVFTFLAPLIIGLLPAVLTAGTLNLQQINLLQGGMPWQWGVFKDPGTLVASVVVFVSLSIWERAAPFDFSINNTEFSGGIVLEMSGIRSSLLKMQSVLMRFLFASLFVSLYLGGWNTPFDLSFFGRASNLVEAIFFTTKVFGVLFFAIIIKNSVPRVHISQLVRFSWKFLVPGAVFSLFVSACWQILLRTISGGGVNG
ncbi:MAG: NADH-quinone oxidoreductase subunit H [Bacteriovoracia bacterium]